MSSTLAYALISLLALGACVSADDRPARWSYIHAAIIVPSCATATCHSSISARGGLVFEDPDETYEALVDDVPGYVVPGDDTSALLPLLTGEERIRMPPDAPLPEGNVEMIRAWIVEGAER